MELDTALDGDIIHNSSPVKPSPVSASDNVSPDAQGEASEPALQVVEDLSSATIPPSNADEEHHAEQVHEEDAVDPGDDDESVGSVLSQDEFHEGLHEDMLKALDSIQSTGTFADAHKLKTVVPGLFVHDVGAIHSPLQEVQARQLIAKARQAPFGKGSDTVVDTSVRNTWELDPSQFELRDPEWPLFIEKLCEKVSAEAGLGGAKIQAHLYKMLIYEKGAMFKAHTDTEKVPGMLGTLVICLPSPHQGGNVVVRHCGMSKTFQTENTAQAYLWWFSDVSHEVLPVTSGYRWVLTYNLALDPLSTALGRPSASVARDESRPLRHTLRRWLAQPKQDRESNYLYYALDHQYTQANISHRGLKTRDLAVVDVLHQLSLQMPFDVFLAVLEKAEAGECEQDYDDDYYRGRRGYHYGHYHYGMEEEEEEEEEENDDDDDDGNKEDGAGKHLDKGSGGEDESDVDEGFHEFQEVLDTNYSILKLVDLSGVLFGSDSELDLDHILQGGHQLFKDSPKERDYEGYMGNSGPSATHFYRRSALVIVPRDHLVEYLVNMNRAKTADYLAECFMKLCSSLCRIDRPSTLSIWAKFYDVFESRRGMAEAKPETKLNLLRTALLLNDGGLWNAIIATMASGKYDIPREFFSDACAALLESKVAFDDIAEGMSKLIAVLPTFAAQCQAIKSFTNFDDHEVAEVDAELNGLAQAWARKELARVLTADQALGTNDGSWMVTTAHQRFDFSFFKESTVPLFRKNIKAFGFSLEYLNLFHRFTEADGGDWSSDEAKALYKSLATSLIDVFDASALHSIQGLRARAALQKSYALNRRFDAPPQGLGGVSALIPSKVRQTIVTHDVLAIFMKCILAEDLPLHTVQKLFFRLTDQADRISVAEFHPLWFPFLSGLFRVLEDKSIPLTTPRYRHFAIAVFESYVKNYVQEEPRQGSDLTRQRVICSCADCNALNAFLVSPGQKVGRFPLAERRRRHLEMKLEFAGIDCTHTTERYGNPHALVVTKTFKQQAKEVAEWQKRAAEATRQFGMFDQAKLRTVLGSEFSTITELESVRAGSRRQSGGGAANSNEARRGQQLQSAGLPPNPPGPVVQPQNPSPQHGFSAQQWGYRQPEAQAQPGVLPGSSRAQPAAGSGAGVLTPVSGNQTSWQSGPFVKVESPGPRPVENNLGSGKKRKASELDLDDLEVIDLTGFD